MTTTHTHVITEFADPYLRCDECLRYVDGYISYQNNPRECEHKGENVPCRHNAGITSDCPSWSPFDGCNCVKNLGRCTHALREEKPIIESD